MLLSRCFKVTFIKTNKSENINVTFCCCYVNMDSDKRPRLKKSNVLNSLKIKIAEEIFDSIRDKIGQRIRSNEESENLIESIIL